MIVYHVTTAKKLRRYLEVGRIDPPVRAWESAEYAAQFSIQTGRAIILRLKFPDDAPRLEGHENHAYVLYNAYTNLGGL